MSDDLSRRHIISGMLAASGATLLGGCGPDSSPTPTPAPNPSPTPFPTFTPSPTPTPTSSLPTADEMNRNTYDGRLFGPTSPWNTPIPATANADPNSANMIANLALAFTNDASFAIATDATGYSVPIYYADASTSRVRVYASTTWWDDSTFTSVPMPPQATPDPKADKHLVVWDVPNALLYEYWHMVKNVDGSWSAGAAVKFSATALGYQTGIWELSARAYGGSLAAGAIRYSEMTAGVIPHALAMSYQYTRGDYYARGTASDGTVAIASHNDNVQDPARINPYNIPEGARLRLKPSVDIAARAATKSGASQVACQIIGEALRTYGAYMVDYAGGPTFYAENLQGKAVSWTGLLDTADSRPFLASDFEVLTLPNLTSSNLRGL